MLVRRFLVPQVRPAFPQRVDVVAVGLVELPVVGAAQLAQALGGEAVAAVGAELEVMLCPEQHQRGRVAGPPGCVARAAVRRRGLLQPGFGPASVRCRSPSSLIATAACSLSRGGVSDAGLEQPLALPDLARAGAVGAPGRRGRRRRPGIVRCSSGAASTVGPRSSSPCGPASRRRSGHRSAAPRSAPPRPPPGQRASPAGPQPRPALPVQSLDGLLVGRLRRRPLPEFLLRQAHVQQRPDSPGRDRLGERLHRLRRPALLEQPPPRRAGAGWS